MELEKQNKLTEAEIKQQIEQDEHEDEKWNDDYDDDGEQEPDYYYCFSCQYSCAVRPAWGGQCPKCTAIMEPEYF